MDKLLQQLKFINKEIETKEKELESLRKEKNDIENKIFDLSSHQLVKKLLERQ